MSKSDAIILIIIIIVILMLTGCAEAQPHIQPYLEGTRYGFLGGLWHGMIAPFSFVASLFNDSISVWAVNNNGGWYTFGFMLGIGGFSGLIIERNKN